MNIVSIGGGEIGRPGFSVETLEIDKELLLLTGTDEPKVLFIGTALGDDALYKQTIQEHFGDRLGCSVSVLEIWERDVESAEIVAMIEKADVVYVGAGDTAGMLRRWHEMGVDEILRRSAVSGRVLSGVSAGAVCWYHGCISGSETHGIRRIDGLGFVRGTLCPHYRNQSMRREFVLRLVEETGESVLGLDDCSSLFHIEGRFKIVASHSGAQGTLVVKEQGVVKELTLRQGMFASSLRELAI